MEMGGEPVWVAEADRALYHAALANASNHLITLATQSMELLRARRRRRSGADARAAHERQPG